MIGSSSHSSVPLRHVGTNFPSLVSLVMSQFLLHRVFHRSAVNRSQFASSSRFVEDRTDSNSTKLIQFVLTRSCSPSSFSSSRVIRRSPGESTGSNRIPFIDRQFRYGHWHSDRARVLAYAVHWSLNQVVQSILVHSSLASS